MGEWVRAKACSTNSCIEVQAGELVAEGTVAMRNNAGQYLIATEDEWATFVQGVKDGDFDDVG